MDDKRLTRIPSPHLHHLCPTLALIRPLAGFSGMGRHDLVLALDHGAVAVGAVHALHAPANICCIAKAARGLSSALYSLSDFAKELPRLIPIRSSFSITSPRDRPGRESNPILAIPAYARLHRVYLPPPLLQYNKSFPPPFTPNKQFIPHALYGNASPLPGTLPKALALCPLGSLCVHTSRAAGLLPRR